MEQEGVLEVARACYGRTLGILGFGSIGQEVARRAQAFGMNLAIWSEIGVEIGRDGLPADLPAGGPAPPVVRRRRWSRR